MKRSNLLTGLTVLGATALLAGCQSAPELPEQHPPAPEPEPAAAPAAEPAAPAAAYVVDVVAEDYAFEAPDEIESGWVTFRLSNEGEETHFLYLTRLPDDRTYDDYVEGISAPFNEIWHALRAGEMDKATAGQELGAKIPGWYWTGARPFGGPGLVAAGDVSRATVRLEPGTYVMECFMKTPEGEFHWAEGMIRPLEVLAEASGAPEPEADVDLTLTTEGFATSGELGAGTHTIAVHFTEQPEAGFGNDVHVARLDDGMDAEALVPWLDAFNVNGLANPAPATFIGGTHEQPEGGLIYFTVDFAPGRYAWVSEAPDVRPLVQEFTVP
ncbi:MAG: hypothetical protein GWM90_22180 [Gemmatimonadetes bacterium]|nr:hypothetical protein [Gemmatimonadota bacterium]NIQ57311.1 hypothetical protein [Gemmatimonadota bacterium]NIU77469.1 hypothetical protein [Gammaproteobacteria bacterium]NIX46692.1 hypothetical protein [Gemmatimonadota bacterium]NIY11035.1 hypothetical protein [Gemmatimonadota bacterium]